MMAKPMKILELHYPVIQFLIMEDVPLPNHTYLHLFQNKRANSFHSYSPRDLFPEKEGRFIHAFIYE